MISHVLDRTCSLSPPLVLVLVLGLFVRSKARNIPVEAITEATQLYQEKTPATQHVARTSVDAVPRTEGRSEASDECDHTRPTPRPCRTGM